MSRLYEALAERRPAEQDGSAAPDVYVFKRRRRQPMVYRGEMTGCIYLQHLEYPFEPVLIGNTLRDVEELRDTLNAFLDGVWEEAK